MHDCENDQDYRTKRARSLPIARVKRRVHNELKNDLQKRYC